MQYIITEQKSTGKCYGRIPDSDDGHDNEIDCLKDSPEEALESLLEQVKELT